MALSRAGRESALESRDSASRITEREREVAMLRIVGGLVLLVVLAGAAAGEPVRDGRTIEQWYRAFVDPRSKERERAAIVLRGFGAGAVPWLRKALSDPWPAVREQAAGLLGSMQEFKDAEGDLCGLLAGDTVIAVRVAAAKALGNIGADRPVTTAALADALAHDPETAVRRAAADALIHRCDELGATVLGLWLTGRSEGALVSRALREAKGKAGRMLGKLAAHESWIVRATAMEILTGIPEPEVHVPSSIRERLEDESAAVRVEAVRFVSRCLDETLLPALMERTSDEHPIVRRAAVVALARGKGGNEALRNALVRLTADADDGVRHAAVVGMRSAPETPETLAALRARLADDSRTVRVEAAVALAGFGNADEAVCAVLLRSYPRTWWPIRPPFYGGMLVEGRGARRLRAEFILREATPEDVGRAIARCGRRALPRLLSELTNEDRNRRLNALWILDAMGEDGVETMARGLTDVDRGVRLVAAVHLARRSSHLDAAVPILVDALAENADGDDVHLRESWEERIDEVFFAIGGKVRPILERLLESESPAIRKTAKKLIE
jgi:HEAT repeat protein